MSDQDKRAATGELRDHQKPLLDGFVSPQGSDAEANEKINIPDAAGDDKDDAVSGFTQADYRNPQKVFKNENQSKLDSFLNFFGDSAGKKGNERDDDGQKKSKTADESDMSEGTVKSIPNQEKEKDSAKAGLNAPDDAKGCKKIDSLKEYIKNEAKLIQNPRKAYFQLSKKYYEGKYPAGHTKKTIKVESFVATQDNKNYLRNLTLDVIQSQQGNMPVVKTYEYDYNNSNNFVKALKFYDYKNDCKLLQQVKVDAGFMDEQYRTLDISTLHFQNNVIFYARSGGWLQLQKFDVIAGKLEEIPNYQIQIPNPDEIVYHPIFSQEFGQPNYGTGHLQLKEFLDQQFVICQEYRTSDSSNKPESMKMFSLSDTTQPIEQYQSAMGVLSDAIQKVAHIKQYEAGQMYYTFIAFDAFKSMAFVCPADLTCFYKPTVYSCNNETQMQYVNDINNPSMNHRDKYKKFAPFLSI